MPKQKPSETISSLPPDLLVKIISLLPVSNLSVLARTCRRFKVLSYNDQVYIYKLHKLHAAAIVSNANTDAVHPPSSAEDSDDLAARLRQFPGGQFLPNTTANYLETGSMFSTASDPVTPLSANTPVLLQVQEETTIPSNTPVSITTDDPFITTSPSVKTNADGSAPNHRQITSSLPDMRNSSLIIGAGGLKAALAKQAQQKQNSVGYSTIGRNALHKPTNLSLPHLRSSEKSARLVFKQIYEKLSPLYFDFREKQKDSKLFLENKDLSVIGALLCQLRLFDRAGFVSHSDDISFSLETTIEWFESMVIGQFERAYDRTDTAEMRTAATSLYNLNGGLACVNVFISKNQIFFDHTFNPSLVASNLPATTGPSVGYALADDFAKFMDYMLNNCKAQAQLISCIFVPQLNTMTLFVNKVFEDSISEYMTAILVAAKSRENLAIYLHTLATCIYSCSQFIDYISKNETGVYVDVDMSRKVMQDIVGPYVNKYIDQEMEYLNKRFKTELSKWDNRVSSNATAVPPADTFLSAEHVQEHKRFVMKTMKAIMFAPVTLTMSLAHMSTGGKLKPHRQALLNDAEPIASEISPVSTSDRTGVAAYQLDESSINSFVSLELALHLMHANKEALGRCLVVTASTDMSKIRPNVQKVFIALLKAIGERHIKLAFLKAVEHMSKSSPIDSTDNDRMVNMDSLQFFELVHVADLIQQMVDVYYNEDVKIWIDEQDFLSDIIVEKKAFERLLDDGVAGGMDKAIQLLVNQCEFILVSTQPVTEYNPPENGLLDCRPTKACEKVIECLTTHTKLMNGVTEKNTMEVFLGEVGVRLFGVIIKNIRRLQVSQTGALQLICDMNRYYEWATSIRVPSVTKQFAVLKELGNLFLADGSDELRKMVHDAPRYQGALRIEEIYELLQSRTDYKKIQKQVESKECIIQ